MYSKPWWKTGITRSQAVARIADPAASQYLWGHVTSSVTWSFDSPYAISYWWSFGNKPLSLTVSEIYSTSNVDLDTTSKQRSRSFILVPIVFSYDFLQPVNSNLCSRTHRLATIQHVTDDRRWTQHCTNSATVSTVG